MKVTKNNEIIILKKLKITIRLTKIGLAKTRLTIRNNY
jgi:hypothetical protein